MNRRALACILPAILAALLLAGCQSSGGTGELDSAANQITDSSHDPAVLPSNLPSLPAPSTLLAQEAGSRSTSYMLADLTEQAESYKPALPNRNVTANIPAGRLDFSPSSPGGNSAAGLAYVTLDFDIDDYDLDNQVYINWATQLPAASDVWLGMADWDSDRWRWYGSEDFSSSRLVPALEQQFFTPEGIAFVVVLLMGETAAGLDSVRIGTPRPQVEVEVTGPASSFTELTASFDASGSQTFKGELSFEWDFEGDGTFEEDTGTNATNEHTYTEPGTYNATVRATDTESGLTGTGSATVSVASSWSHSLGGSYNESINDVAAASDGTVWACGYVQDNGVLRALSLLHFSAIGELLHEVYWAPQEGAGDAAIAREIEIAPDGTILMLSTIQIDTQYSTLLQGWSPQAELLWTERYAGSDYQFSGLRFSGSRIYLVGDVFSGVTSRNHGVVSTFYDTGSSLSTYITDNPGSFNDVVHFEGVQVGESGLYFCGNNGDLSLTGKNLQVTFLPDSETNGTVYSWGGAGLSEDGVALGLFGFGVNQDILVATQFSTDTIYETGIVDLSSSDTFSYATSTQQTLLKDFVSLGGEHVLACSVSVSFPIFQTFNSAQSFLHAFRYTPDVTCRLQGADVYAGAAILTGGSITAAVEGDFDTESLQTNVARSSVWTNAPLHFSAQSNPWDKEESFTNASTLGPGTLDSGGGGEDAWIGVFER